MLVALACCSCATRPLQGVIVPVAEIAEGVSRVPVLIATTRQRSTEDAGDMFGNDGASTMAYARVVVSIPPDGVRKIGAIQWPIAPPGDSRRDFVKKITNLRTSRLTPQIASIRLTLLKGFGRENG